jgi:5'-deoxynucleotidase
MIKFITDIQHKSEPDILTPNKHHPLLIISLEGQLLKTFQPPKQGWTHEILCSLNRHLLQEWLICGADAYLLEQWVGSTEV